MEEKQYPEDWMVVDHFIPGVTSEMIDWWWVNMEKGYDLWCHDEHKDFKWEIKPPMNGHIGAVQIATESIDYSPVMDLRIEWVDPNIGTEEQKEFWAYEHLLSAGTTGKQPGTKAFVMLSHQWETVPGGCKMRSCMHGISFQADFSERDDQNWLKWIIIKKEAGKMKLITHPIPIQEYKAQQ